jgi:hypothetical protein
LRSPGISGTSRCGRSRSMYLARSPVSSPGPEFGLFHLIVGDAEISLGHVDAAIDAGLHVFPVYSNLAAAYAHAGKIDEANAALAEARRLNPAITIKWMKEHTPNLPAVFDGLRKAGCRRNEASLKAASGSGCGCDARRFSTGRSIRAWRTLCGPPRFPHPGAWLGADRSAWPKVRNP